MPFDAHSILNLIAQTGGDHQQAAQQFQSMGVDQVDPNQHADLLQQNGIDSQQLQSGGYQQHFDAQQDPNFQGYRPGSDFTQQQPQFQQ